MNYEEKYKEAIESIKRIYNQADSYGKELMEKEFPELRESEDEKIRKALIDYFDDANKVDENPLQSYGIHTDKAIAWLEKQGKQKPYMIQWKGNNLKEIVEFTGKSPKFNDWFKTWEEYENYVHAHNNIFKLFNEDGSHVEVPVGAWIIKTPDGYNMASRCVFKQKPTTWSEEDEEMLELLGVAASNFYPSETSQKINSWLNSHKLQTKQEWSEEDEKMLDSIIDCLDGLCFIDPNQLNWLKSIKPNHWKPSEEQMEALNAINNIGELSYAGQADLLIKLYNDLEKL